MSPTPARKAPKHLKCATRRWLEQLDLAYELEDHHWRLLILAGECWDRVAQAREVLDRVGVTYLDRFGAPRPRPEVAVERDNRIVFARLVREVGLDATAPPDPRIPRGAGYRPGA